MNVCRFGSFEPFGAFGSFSRRIVHSRERLERFERPERIERYERYEPSLRSMKRSLRSWLWRVPIDQEIDEEIGRHIEMRTRELIERGMDPAAARELVLARIGDLGDLKPTCIDLGRKRDREMRLHNGSRTSGPFAAVTIILAITAAIACTMPALRAARVDPAVTSAANSRPRSQRRSGSGCSLRSAAISSSLARIA
jgi:hypothetical protein